MLNKHTLNQQRNRSRANNRSMSHGSMGQMGHIFFSGGSRL